MIGQQSNVATVAGATSNNIEAIGIDFKAVVIAIF